MILNAIREWTVELPERGTTQWTELVTLLFNRDDLSPEWWPTEMVVSALISEGESSGGSTNFGYRFIDNDGKLTTKCLARVRQVPARSETVFDPQKYAIALEAIN